MRDSLEQSERAQGKFLTTPMKALQIIQTLLLLTVIGLGAWIGNTTVDSSRSIARMEETIRGMGSDATRLSVQIEKLTEEHYALDRRVTRIEARDSH